jgi:hypothetical protein
LKIESGKWKIENGKLKVENGKLKMESKAPPRRGFGGGLGMQ